MNNVTENDNLEPTPTTEFRKSNAVIDWFLRLLKGTLIGIGAILPGLSGGVMMVIFWCLRTAAAVYRQYSGQLFQKPAVFYSCRYWHGVRDCWFFGSGGIRF